MSIEIKIVEGLKSVDAKAWNALGNSDPFISYEFLFALERSGSVGEGTGWQPLHLLAFDGDDLAGAMPLYAKSHSFGEYVFDHAFADAYERGGGNYYPKLLAASPFTPVSGKRILTKNTEVATALLETALSLGRSNGLSSFHINYCADEIEHPDFLERHSVQYHFDNPQYQNFDDFLAELSSSKRKTIRRERRDARDSRIKIQRKTGRELDDADWDCFWACYQDTGARKWGSPYLNHSFFDEISSSMAEEIMMVIAYENERPIATALNFFDDGRVLGRYWGALADYKFLHFELCYYQAIEFAIERGIKTVEAGAQGEHKIARGYAPKIMKSYHHFYHPEFHKMIGRYLRGERDDNAYYCREIAKRLPFKKAEELCE